MLLDELEYLLHVVLQAVELVVEPGGRFAGPGAAQLAGDVQHLLGQVVYVIAGGPELGGDGDHFLRRNFQITGHNSFSFI